MSAVSIASIQEPATESVARRPKVLVAEDSFVTKELLVLLLQRRGYDVAVAEDGKAALDALNADQFDICLLDFRMPILNGLEVVERYRATEAGKASPTRFIGVTADIEGLLAHPSNCENLDMVFSKPVQATEIFSAIETSMLTVNGGTATESAPIGTGEDVQLKVIEDKQPATEPTLPEGHFRSPETGEIVRDRRTRKRLNVSLNGTRIRLPSGEEHECCVVSLSPDGALLTTDFVVLPGEELMVGSTRARVTRVDHGEVAVEFLRSN